MISFQPLVWTLVSLVGLLLCLNGVIAYNPHEPYIPHSLSDVPHAAVSLATGFWDVFGPGGKFHPAAFIEHKGHLVLEGLLVVVILYLFLQKSFNPSFQKQLQTELTEQASTLQSLQQLPVDSTQCSRYCHGQVVGY